MTKWTLTSPIHHIASLLQLPEYGAASSRPAERSPVCETGLPSPPHPAPLCSGRKKKGVWL